MREVILFIRKQINFIINDQKYFILVSFLSGILQCYERIFILINSPGAVDEALILESIVTFVRCLLNGLHIYLFILFLYFIFRNRIVSLLISQIFIILLLGIDFFKKKYLSLPLTPGDIFLLPEAIKVSPLYLIVIIYSLSFFCAVLVIYFIYRRFNKYRMIDMGYPSVISMMIILCVLIPSYIINYHPSLCSENIKSSTPYCRVLIFIPDTKNWLSDRYKSIDYGFFIYYFAKVLDSIVLNVDKKEIPYDEISKIIKKDSFIDDNKNYPNIIIIMDESFTDPRKIDKSFNQYDFSFIDTHKKTNFISPTFGGGTANVEFEVLTGLNSIFLSGEPPYILKIKQETYSLPYYLKNLKYQTVVIHNNNKGFYNRDIVYPKLGFSEFISLEDMPFIKDNKTWPSDDLIFDNLREVLADKSENAKFIYAITVENHPFYDDHRYGEQYFDLPQNIKEKDRNEISTYSAGVILQNKRLNAFVNYLKTVKRPTLLLVFGDHQPLMSFTNERDPEKTSLDSFKTPLMVWSNYDVDLTELNKPYIASSFLAPKILKMANIPLPNYFKFIEQVSECYDVIHTSFIFKKGECSNEKGEKLLKNYQDLNIDILNGKNYTYSILTN